MQDLIFETIFGNKERVKIIRYFLWHEDEKTEIEKLRKFLKISGKKGFQKEIQKLKKANFLKSAGKRIFLSNNFSFNQKLKNFAVFPSSSYKENLTDQLRKTGQIKMIVFGGVLADDFNFADLDLLIVGNPLKEKKIEKLIEKVEIDLAKEINYLILSRKEFEYRYSLFDKLVRGILESKNEIPIKKFNFDGL